MDSHLSQLLVTSRLEDDIRAAAASRQVRELRRQARATAATPTKRRWFARRRVATTP
jgi:hypothetical protein